MTCGETARQARERAGMTQEMLAQRRRYDFGDQPTGECDPVPELKELEGLSEQELWLTNGDLFTATFQETEYGLALTCLTGLYPDGQVYH